MSKNQKEVFIMLLTLSETKQIEISLESLRSNDDMDVLSALYSLSSDLSLANDSVVEDPSMVPLVKELIILFDRCLMPDIACKNSVINLSICNYMC
jgi:hypothetical protein